MGGLSRKPLTPRQKVKINDGFVEQRNGGLGVPLWVVNTDSPTAK